MKHVLLSFCLTYRRLFRAHHGRFHSCIEPCDEDGIPSTINGIPSRVGSPSDQHEVHAVVVDMPQRASLAHASPDTWGTLPTFDPPYEQSPTTPVLQVAMN